MTAEVTRQRSIVGAIDMRSNISSPSPSLPPGEGAIRKVLGARVGKGFGVGRSSPSQPAGERSGRIEREGKERARERERGEERSEPSLPGEGAPAGMAAKVGEGGGSACTTFKRVFKTFKHKQLLRERGGRAVCQR